MFRVLGVYNFAHCFQKYSFKRSEITSVIYVTSYFSLPLIEETVVYVLDEIDDVSKTEMILKKFGIQNFKCYLDGMENWIKFGGTVEFPRFIQFMVSLRKSLHF